MIITYILIIMFLMFRWPILQRFLGTIYMFLFDAFLFTIIAAINLASSGPMAWLNYAISFCCIYFAISAGTKYLKYSEIQRIENEQGKSDT